MNLKHTWLCIKRRFTGFKPGDIVWYYRSGPLYLNCTDSAKALVVKAYRPYKNSKIHYLIIPWFRLSTSTPRQDETYDTIASELQFRKVADIETLLTSSIKEVRDVGLRMKR